MSGLCHQCVCCSKPATDEYHYYEELDFSIVEVVWELCEECCEFAVDVVECVSNLEEELRAWISRQT